MIFVKSHGFDPVSRVLRDFKDQLRSTKNKEMSCKGDKHMSSQNISEYLRYMMTYDDYMDAASRMACGMQLLDKRCTLRRSDRVPVTHWHLTNLTNLRLFGSQGDGDRDHGDWHRWAPMALMTLSPVTSSCDSACDAAPPGSEIAERSSARCHLHFPSAQRIYCTHIIYTV